MKNMTKRPNVLWLMSDQHNANCTGYRNHPDVKTPNLDRIARKGVDFTRAFCNNPICAPSRACFITGEYIKSHRMAGNYVFDWPESKREHLGYCFRQYGYQTALIGKAHMVGLWNGEGFEYKRYCDLIDSDRRDPHSCHYFKYLDDLGLADYYEEGTHKKGQEYTMDGSGPARLPYEHSIERYTGNEAIEFLDNRDVERPFFLQLSFQRPHAPIAPSEDHFGMYDKDDIVLPDSSEDWLENEFAGKPDIIRARLLKGCSYPLAVKDRDRLKQVMASYYSLITVIDSEIGRVLDKLEARGELDNTIIFYTSDHGDFAGEHGLFHKNLGIYESIMKIPFLLSWPGGPEGLQSDILVESVDLFPTLCSLCHIPLPDGRDGVDLVKEFAGGIPEKEAAFCEWHTQGKAITAIRTDDYRLVYYQDEGEGELYYHEKDPGELRNLWDDPAYLIVRHTLLLKLMDYTMSYKKKTDSSSDKLLEREDRYTPGELVQFGKVYWGDLKKVYREQKDWDPQAENLGS